MSDTRYSTGSYEPRPTLETRVRAETRIPLIKIAAECHRRKWQFSTDDEVRLPAAEARGLVKSAFNVLHNIGDMAHKAAESLRKDSTNATQPNEAASLTEKLIQAAVDYESGRCSQRELSESPEPVAYRWKYIDPEDKGWTLRTVKPRFADDKDVICEPLYLGVAYASRNAVIEECAKHLEHEADVATNSLHCGDNSQTIAATHRISRAYHEAAKSIRALAHPSTGRATTECPHAKTPRNLHDPCQICGALGPWFDSCAHPSTDRGTP